MKLQDPIEKTLRRWQLWVLGIPLIIIIISSIMTKHIMTISEILLGFVFFPGYIAEAMLLFKFSIGSKLLPYLITIIPYALYIFFIIKAKTLNKKFLYILAIIILILIIFGIKGCTPALSHGIW